MIDEEDFAVIEGVDPPLAFVRLVRRFRVALDHNLESTDSSDAAAIYRQEYMNHVCAAADALGIAEFRNWTMPIGQTETWKAHQKLTAELDRYIVNVQIRSIRQPSRDAVGLEASEKREIRHYVEQIKTVIEESRNVELPKKERLFDRINDFLAELDKERTPLKVLSDIVIELSRTGGKAAEELEPAWKWVKLIAGVFGARQENETAGLPKPVTQKKLAPPSKKLPNPLDDEIPF